jgi:phosphate transport system protein
MFRTLLRLLKQRPLMEQTSERAEAMLEKAETISRAALDAALEKRAPTFDLYALDREINEAEIEIRRLILQHLSVNPEADVTPALIVTSTINAIERIGDYAKNIYELSLRFPEPLVETSGILQLKLLADELKQMFSEVRAVFAAGDTDGAADAMRAHADLGQRCERLIDDVVNDPDRPCRQAVLIALGARYVKRVSAHLSNLASGIANPFDRVGFHPAEDKDKDKDKG